jgi:hypothetical protein
MLLNISQDEDGVAIGRRLLDVGWPSYVLCKPMNLERGAALVMANDVVVRNK